MNNDSVIKSILLLAANPKGTNSLRLQEEEREIRERLRLAGYGKVPINSVGATRPKDIQQAMLDFKPQIVHFSGHGVGEDGLVFEDATGQGKLVDSEALAQMFRLFSGVECVVLNACFSKVQAEAIAQHVDYVVGMSQSINDRAAIEFSLGFYSALGAGESIDFAYELGCNAILLEGVPGNLIPVLIRKADLILAQQAATLSESMKPSLYKTASSKPAENFSNRIKDLTDIQRETYINRAISYIERWNGPNFPKGEILRFCKEIKIRKYDERIDFISRRIEESEELNLGLLLLLNFLEEMALLISQNLVDEALLFKFFRYIVISYVELFSVWIQVRRVSTGNKTLFIELTNLYESWKHVEKSRQT